MQSRIPVASMSTVTISCNCEGHSSSFPHPLSTIFGDSLYNISFKSWVSIVDDVVDTESGYREYTHRTTNSC